jgi:hypothetical protein
VALSGRNPDRHDTKPGSPDFLDLMATRPARDKTEAPSKKPPREVTLHRRALAMRPRRFGHVLSVVILEL